MATRIVNGGPVQNGPGKSVCTYTGGTRIVPGMKLGPDGGNWDLLDRAEVVALFGGATNFRHAPRAAIQHLCASKGTWAFQIFTSSLPHGVVFLHIRPPAALVAAMGADPNILNFTGPQMWAAYQYAEMGSRAPRVWRRNVAAWDEIAVNFCVKNH